LKFGNEKIGQKTKGGSELPFECNFFKPAVSTTKFLFFFSLFSLLSLKFKKNQIFWCLPRLTLLVYFSALRELRTFKLDLKSASKRFNSSNAQGIRTPDVSAETIKFKLSERVLTSTLKEQPKGEK